MSGGAPRSSERIRFADPVRRLGFGPAETILTVRPVPLCQEGNIGRRSRFGIRVLLRLWHAQSAVDEGGNMKSGFFLNLQVASASLALVLVSGGEPMAAADTVRIGTGSNYPVAVVKIPVEDANTKSVFAVLFEPAGAGPFPAVIILNGCVGLDADADIVRRLNAEYLVRGIATLVLDSFSPRGITSVCGQPAPDRNVTIGYRVKDAYAAVNWLSTRPEIDSKRIFFQGYSHGAIAAISATNARNPVTATQQQKVAGVIAFYPYCFSPDIKFSVPTIILIGQLDDWTPARACEGISDKTNLAITVFPNARHAFATPGLDGVYGGYHLKYDEAATNDAQRRAREFIASSAPAASRSASEWIQIYDPAELRALYSNKTFVGAGVTSMASFISHYSADGRGVSILGGKTYPRTWAVDGDQVCVTSAAGTDCWIYWRHRDDRKLVKSTRLKDGWTWKGTVEDGIPKF